MTTAPALGLLAVRSTPVDDADPRAAALLDLLPEHGGLAWTLEGEGLVGWGEAARLELPAGEADPFGAAQRWWDALVARAAVHDEVGVPGSGLVAFGSFAFDAARASSVLVVPEVLVGRRDGRTWVTTVGAAAAGLPERPAVRSPGAVRFADATRTGAEWVQVVAAAVERIRAGELDKVVLARDLEARSDGPLDLRWPLRRLAAGYPGCWTFCVDGLLGATPEMLVRLVDGVATSRVLAGTLRRSGDANKDLRKSRALERSIKEVEEHGYGVRSVADALAQHCSTVEVPPSPFVLDLPNVMHLATDVRGVVTDGATSLGLVASLHPSAAVCGTPTATALALITEVEGMDRGRYAGPVGWLDARGDGEWGIALRCAEVDPADPSRLRLFAGCGIVAGSNPVDELAETLAKLVPMRDALEDDAGA
ncbi:MAG: isochorismate synthase [Frankiales bacterium]|nr:isochorismate synthase [Frankiales bacterium]